MNHKKTYTFRYQLWGVWKEEIKAFPSMREAMTYAVEVLPKKGYLNIQPPKEHIFLKK